MVLIMVSFISNYFFKNHFWGIGFSAGWKSWNSWKKDNFQGWKIWTNIFVNLQMLDFGTFDFPKLHTNKIFGA